MGRSWKVRRLREMVARLRRDYPTPYPVTVQLRRLPGRSIHRTDGMTSRRGRRLYLFLDSRLTWAETVEVLCHEWAHAATWRHERVEATRKVDHDPEWSLAYGRIYSAFHDGEPVGE